MINCALNHAIWGNVECKLLVPLDLCNRSLIQLDALLNLGSTVLIQTRAHSWWLVVSSRDHAYAFYFVGWRRWFFTLDFIWNFHYARWFFFFFCLRLSWSLFKINGALIDFDQLIIYLLHIDVVDLHIVFHSRLDETALGAGLCAWALIAKGWLRVIHDFLWRSFCFDDALGGALGCELLYLLLVQSEGTVHLGVSFRSDVGCCFLIAEEH